MKMITVARNNLELITNIEAYGTWEDERWMFDEHNSFDIWYFNGRYYKIYKDSERIENDC